MKVEMHLITLKCVSLNGLQLNLPKTYRWVKYIMKMHIFWPIPTLSL